MRTLGQPNAGSSQCCVQRTGAEHGCGIGRLLPRYLFKRFYFCLFIYSKQFMRRFIILPTVAIRLLLPRPPFFSSPCVLLPVDTDHVDGVMVRAVESWIPMVQTHRGRSSNRSGNKWRICRFTVFRSKNIVDNASAFIRSIIKMIV